jgi:hypothetical protein
MRGVRFGQSIWRLFVTAATGGRSQLAQGIHLGRSQRTTPPFGQPAQTERSEGDASQAHDLMSDAGKQPPDLAILAVTQTDFEERAVPLSAGTFYPMDAKATLLEVKALFERGKGLGSGATRHLEGVCSRHLKSRMSQPMRQLAVIRQQDEAFATLIQSADSEQSQFAGGHQVDRARSSRRVAAGAQIAARLIE